MTDLRIPAHTHGASHPGRGRRARQRASSSLRAVWHGLREINRRIEECWIGDILAGGALVVFSIGILIIFGVLA